MAIKAAKKAQGPTRTYDFNQVGKWGYNFAGCLHSAALASGFLK